MSAEAIPTEADTDRVMRAQEVCQIAGLSRPTLYRRIAQGTFPAAISLGGKSVGWRASEIQSWVRNLVPAVQS